MRGLGFLHLVRSGYLRRRVRELSRSDSRISSARKRPSAGTSVFGQKKAPCVCKRQLRPHLYLHSSSEPLSVQLCLMGGDFNSGRILNHPKEHSMSITMMKSIINIVVTTLQHILRLRSLARVRKVSVSILKLPLPRSLEGRSLPASTLPGKLLPGMVQVVPLSDAYKRPDVPEPCHHRLSESHQ